MGDIEEAYVEGVGWGVGALRRGWLFDQSDEEIGK